MDENDDDTNGEKDDEERSNKRALIKIDLNPLKKLSQEDLGKLLDQAKEWTGDLLAPILKATRGAGELIEAKFDGMVALQKIRTGHVLRKAQGLAKNSNLADNENPNTSILIPAIEYASHEARDDLRSMWAKLIANEYLRNGVHPEFPRTLARLSADDAFVLATIGLNSDKPTVKAAANDLYPSIGNDDEPLIGYSDEFCLHQLHKFGLIDRLGDKHFLTVFGEEFLKAVSTPSDDKDNDKNIIDVECFFLDDSDDRDDKT